MKDLYLKLGIDQNASHEEIAEALKDKPELSDCSAILLNEERRAAYNRTQSTIRSIGMLRHHLNLDKDNSWFVETCPEFAPRHHTAAYTAKSKAEETAPALNADQQDTATKSSTRKQAEPKPPLSRMHPILIGIAVIVLLVLIVKML
jgi:hypothetical protein